MTEYHTLQELQELAVHQKKEIWQIVQQEDMDASERTQEQSYEKMHQMYEAMKYADASYNGNLRSASGRAGGDGEKLHQYNASRKNICGAFIGLVMADSPTIKRIFTIQEPITFARVISLAPDLILLNDIASSGAHVPKAAIVKAINIFGTLRERDKLLAALTNISENLINIVKPNTSNIIVVNIKLTFYSSLCCPFQSILIFLKLLLLEEIIEISIIH